MYQKYITEFVDILKSLNQLIYLKMKYITSYILIRCQIYHFINVLDIQYIIDTRNNIYFILKDTASIYLIVVSKIKYINSRRVVWNYDFNAWVWGCFASSAKEKGKIMNKISTKKNS